VNGSFGRRMLKVNPRWIETYFPEKEYIFDKKRRRLGLRFYVTSEGGAVNCYPLLKP